MEPQFFMQSFNSKHICQCIEISKNPLTDNFGFLITGGIDQPPVINDKKGIFVSTVQKNSPADKAGLKPNDQILQINGYDSSFCTHKQALKRIEKRAKKGGDETTTIRLLVTRPGLDENLISQPIMVPMNENGNIVSYTQGAAAFETEFL